MPAPHPRQHTRSHAHGGADPVLIAWEDTGPTTPGSGWSQELTATDSSYTSGYGGISLGSPVGSDGANRADDFAVGAAAAGDPVPAVADNFNRADSASLGASWTTIASSPLKIAGNMCSPSNSPVIAGNWHGLYNAAGPFTNMDAAYVIGGLQAGAGGQLWVHGRMDPSTPSSGPSCYSAHYDHQNGQLLLERIAGGSPSALTSKAFLMAVGDTLGIRCLGTAISVWVHTP